MKITYICKDTMSITNISPLLTMQTKGAGLGEMDDMLLSKVEGLTLYVIELKKDKERLKNQG
jgi:hypothetical protein